MVSFILCLLLLIGGYFIYGKIVEKKFGIKKNKNTPAYVKGDGVDYVPLPTWKVFMIQFLNIAGIGPIFGAIMGTMFGTASFIWIVFGSIFAGGVHDYFSGVISMRHGGISLPQIHGLFLGDHFKRFMLVFVLLLLILSGAVFVNVPADLLDNILPVKNTHGLFWIGIIFLYYIIATLLPIDKLIGRIYPLFGACLLFMGFGILVMMFIYQPAIPELWDGLSNRSADPAGNPIFPMMFVSIACGAISGFHATQAPMMARCIKNEKYGRPVFYGSMIMEGFLALVWAAAASYFFYDPEVGVITNGGTVPPSAVIVKQISTNWMGIVGGAIAIFGVISAAVTSGDTIFRSGRLILADTFNINQKNIAKRLLCAAVVFIPAIGLLYYSRSDEKGFGVIWRYFAWANQTMACVTLWSIAIYLLNRRKNFWIALIPAMFMTMVSATYIVFDPHGINLDYQTSCIVGASTVLLFTTNFFVYKARFKKGKNRKNSIPKTKRDLMNR